MTSILKTTFNALLIGEIIMQILTCFSYTLKSLQQDKQESEQALDDETDHHFDSTLQFLASENIPYFGIVPVKRISTSTGYAERQSLGFSQSCGPMSDSGFTFRI